jgi:hypothetical protein
VQELRNSGTLVASSSQGTCDPAYTDGGNVEKGWKEHFTIAQADERLLGDECNDGLTKAHFEECRLLGCYAVWLL